VVRPTIKRRHIQRKHCKCGRDFNNVGKTDIEYFLEKCIFPKLTLEELENLTIAITIR